MKSTKLFQAAVSGRKIIMLATIGKSDLQYVHGDTEPFLCNPLGDKDFDYEMLSRLPLVWHSAIRETEINGKPDKVFGLASPMLGKALDFVASRNIAQIDMLILLPTKRDTWAAKLDALLDKVSDSKSRSRLSSLIAKSRIREYASRDFTFYSASIIKQLLDNHRALLPVMINRTDILGIGDLGFVDSIFDRGEQLTAADLERADINRTDLFDFELTQALMPYLSQLEDADIYLASFSGGLPVMQKSLTKVLQSLLIFPRLITVQQTEKGGCLEMCEPQDEFLNLHRRMNQCAVEMDWEAVRQLFYQINCRKPGYFDESTKEQLEQLLLQISNTQQRQDNWFSNFFVLIIRALYKQDYNNLYIWLKCIIETAWLALLELPENQNNLYHLEKNVRLENYIHDRKGLGNILVFQNGDCIEAKVSEVRDKFPDPNDLLHFNQYFELFYARRKERNRYALKKQYARVIERRNELIHHGKPVHVDAALISSLLDFIGVKVNELHSAILWLKESNWQELQDFEQKILCSSPFFVLIKKIGCVHHVKWLPVERISIQDYMNIVHFASSKDR